MEMPTMREMLSSMRYPILIGLVIGSILSALIVLSGEEAWHLYSERHHCEKKSEQIHFDEFFPGARKETVYVCDGGEVVIR